MNLTPCHCPVCGYTVATRLFEAGANPLATIAWPGSPQEAQAMRRYPEDYLQCLQCFHVWNHLFAYEEVPYAEKPNRMFNNGSGWSHHLEAIAQTLLQVLPEQPKVVEIGCGDGGFLRGLAERFQGRGEFTGFDPSGDVPATGSRFRFVRALFEPMRDLPLYKPDLILMRHVVEHLSAPAEFLQALSWASREAGMEPLLYCEVPCIDRVFETGRLADFYHEHPSQFTTLSFTHLLHGVGRIEAIEHCYGGEVICGRVRLRPSSIKQNLANKAVAFAESIPYSLSHIREQLDQLVTSGQRVAIWGGTGKGAAFMHCYGVTAERFPLVVDSDPRKVGSYVPGVGQEIRPIAALKQQPVEVLIIPTQWRARDILQEASSFGLQFDQVLIEHRGSLINFLQDDHPY
jgi:SAM-dependent methyltransferase